MESNNSSNKLQVKRLHTLAKLPTLATPGSAGYDLYSWHGTLIPAQGKVVIDTGIALIVPPGMLLS